MPQNDRAQGRDNLLYDLDTPDFALRNAMQDVGINPYAANPFTKAVQRNGQSLANSYLIRMANDNTPSEVSPYAVSNPGGGSRNSAQSFGDYLRYNLQGTGNTSQQQYPGRGVDNIQSSTRNAAGDFKGAVGKVRQYRDDLAAGRVDVTTQNPYLVALSDRLGANSGLGTSQFYSDLQTPFMAPSMQTAFSRYNTAAGEQAIRRLGDDPLTANTDIWTYLLGMGR